MTTSHAIGQYFLLDKVLRAQPTCPWIFLVLQLNVLELLESVIFILLTILMQSFKQFSFLLRIYCKLKLVKVGLELRNTVAIVLMSIIKSKLDIMYLQNISQTLNQQVIYLSKGSKDYSGLDMSSCRVGVLH